MAGTRPEPRSSPPPIEHDRSRHRFVARTGNLRAELVYQLQAGQLVMVHTWVPVELRNQGLAGRLTEAATRHCQDEGLIAVGACPFARAWLAHNARRFPGLEVH